MGRKLAWATVAVVALLLVGSMVLSAIGALLKFAIYLAIAVMIVVSVLYLVDKARSGLRGDRRR